MKAKNPTRLLTLITALAATQLAAFDVYEGFDYPDGQLGTQGGGTGWYTIADGDKEANKGWGSFPFAGALYGGVRGTAQATVQAETIAAPADYGLTRSGGELKGTLNYTWPFREFSTANRIDMETEQTVYFSYLFSMDNIGEDGGSYLQLSFINCDRKNLIDFGVGTGMSTVMITQSGLEEPFAVGDIVNPGTSYLFVGKMVLAPGPDTFHGAIYAAGETIGVEPAVWEMETTQDLTVSTAPTVLDRIGVYFGGTDVQTQVDYQGYFDEFRMGDSWEAVTGVSDNPVPAWAGYPYDESGDADTGAFFGWINATLEPWIYSYDLDKYVYGDEANVGENGGWIYIPR
ncbi:MAG: hypothetical protein ACP5I4_11580 [Oceanipulchritudo sp.]